jgi:hypothetical protein
MLRLILAVALSAASLTAGPLLLPGSPAVAEETPPQAPAPVPPQSPRPRRDCHEPPVTS